MPIVRLVYASVSRPRLPNAELRALIRRSNQYNANHGITGLLFYANGFFLQALEGERSAVNRLYNGIVSDPRHSGCEVVHCGEIVLRNFSEWSMKLEGLEPDTARARLRRALLRSYCGPRAFDPRAMDGGQANGFLLQLAELERKMTA